jgi:hypothetical protein
LNCLRVLARVFKIQRNELSALQKPQTNAKGVLEWLLKKIPAGDKTGLLKSVIDGLVLGLIDIGIALQGVYNPSGFPFQPVAVFGGIGF